MTAARCRTLLVALLASASIPLHAQTTKVERPEVKVGDSWKVERKDGFTKAVQHMEIMAVTAVSSERIELSIDGQPYAMTSELALLENARFAYESPYEFLKFPLEPGKSWSFKPKWKNKQSGQAFSGTFEAEVKGLEKVQTAAGEFDAVKLEAKGYLAWSVRITYWYSPKAKAIVRLVWQDRKSDYVADVVEYSLAP